MFTRLTSLLKRFIRDQKGLSALEFALIAPVMLGLYLGSVQATLALNADRKLAAAANTVGDLVTQDDFITTNEMTQVFQAADLIFAPYSTDSLAMVVTSVVLDSEGDPIVHWSSARGTNALLVGSDVDAPANLIDPGGSIIMVKADYAYHNLIGGSELDDLHMRKTVYLRPRISRIVTRIP
ncbi:TadE/TadG family type IV pilus assembly protein [Woodsholea maritima]|uniref:TadE/TadG family type IV pilus assembly protein n=1 Tax=Woodsholea maritima TaxID=240237 RepID=UPI00036F3F09|nr:TadE/TadG family type IV pilus assembly protein [Woodsholea maritima]